MNHRTGKEYKLRMTFNNSMRSWPCLVFLESLPSIDRSGSVKDRRFPNMHLTWYECEWFWAPILKVISKKTYFFSPKVLSNESIFPPQKEVRMIFLIGTGSFFSPWLVLLVFSGRRCFLRVLPRLRYFRFYNKSWFDLEPYLPLVSQAAWLWNPRTFIEFWCWDPLVDNV